MESQRQVTSGEGPPGRPPPPHYPSAPPPYYDSQNVYPTGPLPPPNGAPAPGGPYYPSPPAYPQAYPAGYPPGCPPGYGPPAPPAAPPMYPSGPSLYPDVSQLPQPEAVPLGFMHGGVGSSGAPLHNPPCTDPLTPVRPAPPPPDQSSWAQNPASPSPPILSSGGPEQRPSTPLKDGQPPPGCVVAWRGGDGLQVFFLQSEGHIVSPHKPLMLSVYKRIGGRPFEGDENLLGMLEVPGCCRLKLEGKTTFALHTSGNSYIFIDKSTCPKRMVVLQLPADVSKTMQADLLALINELTDLREEQEGIAEKITTGVGTAYTDLTKKLNTVVKDTVPGAHKSTKWLRKGTGSLVRMGGSAVSKGIHVIADHIPVGEQPKEESPAHTELLAALRQFKKSKEEGSITYV
ncbi:uncharacterized protein [Panulirus ornatus]|uniref:uncharacterized protein isoform X4 n=1 Tax=Panulirus ornatus TaxID=150431 RepID=UPI003A88AE50